MNQFLIAKIAENADPEHLGRVRVKYPFPGEDWESRLSHWARCVTPFAGNSEGYWFLPDVGTEVLVLVQNNDLLNPVVMGQFHHKNAPPPEVTPSHPGNHNKDGKNQLKFIKTKAGHTLSFDDGDTSSIHLKSAKGHKLHIDDQNNCIQIYLENDIKIELQKEVIEIDYQGKSAIKLSGDGIYLKDKNGDKIELSGGKVKISSSKLDLTDNANEPLVRGLKFLKLFNSHTHQVPQSPGGVNPSSPPIVPMTPDHLNLNTKIN